MLAAVVLGLLIGAALGALGGGGSILAVPVLVYVAGQSASAATATSLVAVAAAAAVGLISHTRAGNVRWVPAVGFALAGVGGSWLGARTNGTIDPDVLLLAFSGLILVAAHRMLTACPTCTKVGEAEAIADAELASVAASMATTTADVPGDPQGSAAGADAPGGSGQGAGARSDAAPPGASPQVRTVLGFPLQGAAVARVVVAGSICGFLTGLFGVGGGFVIVPALTLALGMSMPVAIGTSLAVIVGNALVALGFRGLDAVEWDLAVPFTVTMLIGSLVGSTVSQRLPAKKTLAAFAGLLVVVAVANGVAATAALLG